MKILISLMFLVCIRNQVLAQKVISKTDSVVNQGDLERVWTEKLFADKYFLQEHRRFQGKVTVTDTFYFHFGRKLFRVLDSDPSLLTLCKLGILYPNVIPAGITCTDTTTLTYFEEIKYLNLEPTVRRFHFNLNLTIFSNPIVYFIELTNKNATASADQEDFIKDAKLTFIVQGWIMY